MVRYDYTVVLDDSVVDALDNGETVTVPTPDREVTLCPLHSDANGPIDVYPGSYASITDQESKYWDRYNLTCVFDGDVGPGATNEVDSWDDVDAYVWADEILYDPDEHPDRGGSQTDLAEKLDAYGFTDEETVESIESLSPYQQYVFANEILTQTQETINEMLDDTEVVLDYIEQEHPAVDEVVEETDTDSEWDATAVCSVPVDGEAHGFGVADPDMNEIEDEFGVTVDVVGVDVGRGTAEVSFTVIED